MNLLSVIDTTAYNADNQLTQWGTATPTYDADGNTLSDGTNTYVWNQRNQLASMNLTSESFQYDPFGRRAAKTILGTTTNYLYDGANPVQELSGTTPRGLGSSLRFPRCPHVRLLSVGFSVSRVVGGRKLHWSLS